MPGVRKKPGSNGKFQGWFKDSAGKRRFFWGTYNRKETRRMAESLEDEHRQVALGYRPAMSSADRAAARPFIEVRDLYLEWGTAQGGRGGRPWSTTHARMRKRSLGYWTDRLKLRTLGDLQGILESVEASLRDLLSQGLAPKTVWDHGDALKAFCRWCVDRDYLDRSPLERLQKLDTTPRTRRRAMSRDEVIRLLEAAPPQRRLLYEVAFSSGLRAGELRSLERRHLDVARSGLQLEAEWTKDRRPGFQPLPQWLIEKLALFAHDRGAERVYAKLNRGPGAAVPEDPLLYVPSHPARDMDRDMEAAGIQKWNPHGKIDFHAARTAFITFLFESGASLKEAQSLARHSTPTITANTYARTRPERLADVTEKVGEAVLGDPDRAECVPQRVAGAEGDSVNASDPNDMAGKGNGGGGGYRTRVRRKIPSDVYVRIRSFVLVPRTSDRRDGLGTSPWCFAGFAGRSAWLARSDCVSSPPYGPRNGRRRSYLSSECHFSVGN